MYGRIVKEGVTREHVIAECFDRYAKARATQAANKSSTYTATIPNKNGITASARNQNKSFLILDLEQGFKYRLKT